MNDYTLYTLTYLLSQALGVYAVYKLIGAFFNERIATKKTEITAFVGYYVLTSLIYLVINIPLINFAVNLIAVLLLTFLYSSTIRKKLLTALLTYIFMACTEMIVVTLTGYIHFPITERNNYDSVFGIVAVNVLLFAVSMAVNGARNIKKGTAFPILYWLTLMVVPLVSLVILAILFQSKDLGSVPISISIGGVLLINFTVFFLYDSLAKLYLEKQTQDLIEQQNRYYENELKIINASLETSSILRHDMKNHLHAIFTDINNGNIIEAQQHISDIVDVYNAGTEIIHTGYPSIDSIVNFKLQTAKQEGIKVNISSSIPPDLNFSSFDSTVILGNLLDNALLAVPSVSEDGFIDLTLHYSRGMLIIKVSNPFNNEVNIVDGRVITSKADKKNHGFGLRSVKEIVEKYNGTVDIKTDNNVFVVTAILYVE